jgi:putative endonuclease
MRSSKNTYRAGLRAEFIARMYLRFHGYRILHNRYITGRHTNRAELDIIARRGNTIVFVEVKNRPSISDAWDAIALSQIVRLRRAGETYLINHRWSGDARFDVIFVCGWRIRHIKNAI